MATLIDTNVKIPESLDTLVDTNCFFKSGGRVVDEAFIQELHNNPGIFIPDAVYSEVMTRTRGGIRDRPDKNRIRSRIIGEKDPRSPRDFTFHGRGRRKTNVLNAIEDLYVKTGCNYGNQRLLIVRDIQDTERRWEAAQERLETVSEEDLEDAIELYNAQKDLRKFDYLLSHAFEVSDRVVKPDGTYSQNVIYDAYVCALAHYAGVKGRKVVNLVSNDRDISGANGIPDKMLDNMRYLQGTPKTEDEKTEQGILNSLLPEGAGSFPMTLRDYKRISRAVSL